MPIRTAAPLPKELDDRLLSTRNRAWEARQSGDFPLAEKHYLEAWSIFPEPKRRWDSSQIVSRRISEFYLEWKRFPEAEHWTSEIFKCEPLPNDPGPYILLGKIYLEWGKEELAKQNLVKAFEMGGRRGFVGEDPKYLKFAQAQMKR